MSNEKEYLPKIAMSIVAHPDDQDFTVAGTLAKWAKAGCKVISVLITSGDSGSNDVAHDAEYKPSWRNCAKQSSKPQTLCLAYMKLFSCTILTENSSQASLAAKRADSRHPQYKPDVVVTGDPSGWFYGNEYVNHPDHRAAAEAAT